MVYKIIFSKKFAKSLKRLKKSGSFDIKQLEVVIDLLINKSELPIRAKDHQLKGEWLGFRECHVQPDLLLVYEIYKDELRLAEIGSHSELFG
jgi:mRNA interferase YafQ